MLHSADIFLFSFVLYNSDVLVFRYIHTLLKANTYIFADSQKKKALVIDPGAGSAQWVKKILHIYSLDLSGVLLTHGHADHCWDVGVVATDDTPVFIADPDMYRLDNPAYFTGMEAGAFISESGHDWIKPMNIQSLPSSLLTGGGAQIVAGVPLRALPSPGHTEGSCVFLTQFSCEPLDGTFDMSAVVTSGASHQFLITGDVLFHGSVGRTDLPGGNEKEMIETLRTLSSVFDPRCVILPGHGNISTLESEINENFYMKQVLGKV